MPENIFIGVIVTSITGTAAALLLSLLKPITRKHFGASWHYYMWVCVLALMLIPIRINLPERAFSRNPASNTEAVYISPDSEISVTTPIQGAQTEMPNIQADTPNTQTEKLPEKAENQPLFVDKLLYALPYISVIWLCLAATLFIIKLFGYFAFLHHIGKNTEIITLPKICQYTNKKITVGKCSIISSPLMTGIFKSTLLLPDRDFSDEQLGNILSHEIVHFKRHDILIKWFAQLVKCIHFFNPAVYFICTKLYEECEISCDERAVKALNYNGKLSYVDTILRLMSDEKAKNNPLTTGMTGSKALLKKRFLLIKNAKRKSRISVAVSSFTAILLIVCTLFLTGILNGCAMQDKTETPIIPKAEKVNELPSEANSFIGFIKDENSDLIDIYTQKDGDYIMSIPLSVTDGFIAFEKSPGWLEYFDIYCGSFDEYMWAAVCTRPVMSACTVSFCSSPDGGKNWYHDSMENIRMGIVENVNFTTKDNGIITYSGGGYGSGISKTYDGGRTWEHFMEYGYSMPIEAENALTLLKHQLIIAYENTYGSYTPLSTKPTQAVPDSEYLRYIIENLEITKEDDEYYTVPVIWDFLIEKETGRIYKFYNGLDKVLTLFDPYSPTALSFAG